MQGNNDMITSEDVMIKRAFFRTLGKSHFCSEKPKKANIDLQ